MANTITSHYIVEGEIDTLLFLKDSINSTVSRFKTDKILEHNLSELLATIGAESRLIENFVAGDWYDADVVDGSNGFPVLSFMEDYDWVPGNAMEELARSELFINRIQNVFRASVDDDFELVECTDPERKYFKEVNK